jgi:agmatine deiminase
MLCESETNCVCLATLLEERHPQLFRNLQTLLLSRGILVRSVGNVRDIWIRDYAPVQVADDLLVKFRYTPDYLHGYEHLITGDEVLDSFRDLSRCLHSGIVLDGGNVVGCPGKAILTDKVYKENPGRTRPQLRRQLRELLRADELIIIPREPFDPIGHADGMVRFLDENTVLVNDYSDADPEFGDRLNQVLRRHRLQIESLPYCPESPTGIAIPSAVGNFINFLRTARIIIVPVYGIPADLTVMKKLESLIPELPVVPLDGTALAREGGVLNCITATYRFLGNPSG